MALARATFDFFEAQRAARRKTAFLVLLWAAALVPVAALLGTAVLVVGAAVSSQGARDPSAVPVDPVLAFLASAGAATAALLAACAVKAWSLAKGGGREVALSVGATPLDLRPADERDQRLRNVVEEMAIASGLPVPGIFVLRDVEGINALAAGFAPDRAVVAVTQGCLDRLTRDELQGVIGHEFSHVRNGDMVLNVRLVALVHGLTGLAVAGRVLLRLAWDVGSTPSIRSSRRRSSSGVELAIGLTGLLLLAAGALGAFLGSLVTAAVTRQREYLADAASAQFTRDPPALAKALRKIMAAGSSIAAPQAATVGHFFFASAAERWLATHPPVEDRIRRLMGLPDGAYVPPPRDGAPPLPAGGPLPAGALGAAAPSPAPAPSAAAPLPGAAAAPVAPALSEASRRLAALPPEVREAAHEPFGARALACAVVLDPRPEVRARQLLWLGDGPEGAEVRRLAPHVDAAGRALRLTILDLALPALGRLSPAQREALLDQLRRLVEADGQLTVGEWVLLRVARRRLALVGANRPPRPRAATLPDLALECRELLGLLAWVGNADEDGARRSFEAGVEALGIGARWKLPGPREVGPSRLERSLAALEPTPPAVRAAVLAACEACARAVRGIDPSEEELLRAIAASLGVPVPPSILAG